MSLYEQSDHDILSTYGELAEILEEFGLWCSDPGRTTGDIRHQAAIVLESIEDLLAQSNLRFDKDGELKMIEKEKGIGGV